MSRCVELATRVPPGKARADPLHAFEGCGIELEYALVDRSSLDVRPIADEVLREFAGAEEPVSELARGPFGWSNELALHVLEIKNSDPTFPMDSLAARFQSEIRAMNCALAAHGACLLPAGMHPWMDPRLETRLWPHEDADIYRAYDRIFDCHTHGYANLQAVHVNVPFADDREFARLHEAIRLVLPILPAIAASSPYVEGRRAGALDYRMCVYGGNAAAVPQVMGALVPEPCTSRRQYHADILAPLYRAIARHDEGARLQHEWLNARGAIARFERNAIEIRILDTQECPRMDVALAALIVDLVQALYERRMVPVPAAPLPTAMLTDVLDRCIARAEDAEIPHPDYLAAFGLARARCRAQALWEHLAARLDECRTPRCALWREPLAHIFAHGTLARRLLSAAGRAPTRAELRTTYGHLCEALDAGRAFA